MNGSKKVNKIPLIVAFVFVVGVAVTGGAISDRILGYKLLDRFWPRESVGGVRERVDVSQKILTEENVVINVAEKVSPSVVTVGIKKTALFRRSLFGDSDLFSGPFGFFGSPRGKVEEDVEQDIGTGFVLTKDGLIVTNKHVVSDTEAKYKIVLKDDKEHDVTKIYRDPLNDLAILKVEATGLSPVELGDSSKLRVGQFVVAIGTALGEFRHTVTTGVVSGLGRGITAGGPFEGAERLDNVIQTDAAINPGNSGGPLLNSVGQVIGVNTAVSASGQNIGFAIPINVVKDAIDNFNKTGQFNRPYLGVRYRVVDERTAKDNEVPTGAYIQAIVPGSPADKSGLLEGDIIVEISGKKLDGEDNNLAREIGTRKVGDVLEVKVWRDGEEKTFSVTLEEAS